MTLEARRQYLDAVRERYRNSTRAQKTRILDEFCEVCHYSRSYAIRLLLAPKAGRTRRPGPARVYDQRILVHIVRLWSDMGKICSKSMVAAMPAWLPHYRNPDLDEEVRNKLLRISAPTIDRLLQPLKRGPVKGLSTTKPSAWIKSRIPIAVLKGHVAKPGFIEADTVSHCGNSAAGTFVSSLTMTDLASGWTENRAVFGKTAERVQQKIEEIEDALPFLMIGFASDNGTEFMNEQVYNYLVHRKGRPIKFIRRRPYRKNDAAHVEQKNWTHVRQLFGYERYEHSEMVTVMNEIYRAYWNPLMNFFTPAVKLKQKIRIGGRIKKVYDKPKTPYHRLLESEHIAMGIKQKLRLQYEGMNPFTLKDLLDKRLKEFFRLVELTKRIRDITEEAEQKEA